MFYAMLEDCLVYGKEYKKEGLSLTHGRETFDANDFYRTLGEWEMNFVETPNKIRTPMITGDEIELATVMYKKYLALASEYYVDEEGIELLK